MGERPPWDQVNGADWVVARTESGAPVFYLGPPDELTKFRDKPEDSWTA
jgi:hypothetical protein